MGAILSPMLALLLLVPALTAQEPVLLRLRPPAGQVSRYRTAMRVYAPLPGQPPGDTVPSAITCTDMTQSVDSLVGDTLFVRTITDTTRTRTRGLAAGDPGWDALRGMVTVFTMDTRGRVLDSRVVSGALPVAAGGGLSGVMAGLRSDLPSFPAQSVRVGESWPDSVPIKAPVAGAMLTGLMQATSRLDGLDSSGIALISTAGGVFFATRGGPAVVSARGMTRGQVAWDLARGRLVWARAAMDGTINLESMGFVTPLRFEMGMTLADRAEPGVDAVCAAARGP